MEVKFGVQQKVFVTDISGTGKVFVQLDTPEAYQLPELSEAIGQDVQSHLSSPVNPTLGLKCFAHSTVHQTWYRAIVTDIKGAEVTVFYGDYGNSEVIPATQVHALSVGGSADQFNFLYQALCCTLSDFIPEQGRLSPNMVSVLQMLLTNREFAAVFQSRNLSESHPYVPSFPCYNLTLFKTDSGEESVAQELVSNKLGRYSICADSVEVASTAEVFTCFVVSPEKFWIQFSDKFPSLEAIMDAIAEQKELSKLKPLPRDALFPGVACCCQFSADGMFYRAKIIRVSPPEVEVCFIDYGNSEIVSPDTILELPSRLVLTPARALQCCLDGVRPVGEDWTGEACDKFIEISDGRELKGTFVSRVSPDVFSVQLQDGSTGEQLGQALIDCGVAAPSETVSSLPASSLPASSLPASSLPASSLPASSLPASSLPSSSPEFQYLSLEVGQKHKIFVTYVESPSVVWCQRFEFATEFDHVMSGLSEKGPGMPPMTNPVADKACCVLYHVDQTWCRGCIQSVDTVTSTAEVLFVDFGNTEHLNLSDLRLLDSEFFSLPAQAISFSMCEISPQTGEVWSAEAVSKFQDLALEKELVCDVVGLDKDGYPSAKLLDPTQGDKDIGQELARLGYAKSPFLSPMKPQRDERRTPFKSYSQQSRNSSSQSSQKSSPFQSQKSSPYHSERSSPFRSQKPREEGYRDREKRNTSYDKGSPEMAGGMRSQVLYSYSKVKIMNAQSYYVAVSYVKDLEEFYCQLLSSAADLETLMNDIDAHCASSAATPVSSPHKDMPVIAQYSEDQGWYRALINATPSRDQCQVTFIDYGNSESVPLTNVLEIPPQFFHLPAQAFKCALYGVPRDFTPTQQAIEAFTELTLEQNLHCFVKVMPKGKDLCVVELTLSDKTRVIEKLRQDGHLPYREFQQSPRQRDFSQSPRHRDFSQSPRQRDFSQSPRQRDFSQSPRRDFSQSSRQRDYSQSSRQRDYSQRDYSQSSRQRDYSKRDYSQQLRHQEFSLQKDFPELPRRQESPRAPRKKEDTLQQSVPLPQLPTNTHLDVYISFTESPAQFYLQLAESYTTLEQLSTLLEERREVGGEGVRPEVGTFCAAQFSEDKLWYRARVTTVRGSEVEVCFIDYGNSERVRASELRQLQPQCTKLPCSAIPCTLHGLDPAVAKSPEAIQKFSSLTTDRKLVVEFLKPFSSYDSIVPVQLHDTSHPGLDLDITDCLQSQTGTGMGPTTAQTPVLNSSLECSVTFAANPGEFYCQLNSASEAIDVLMDSMYTFYAEEEKGSVITNPTVSSYCAAPFSDGSWYRGKLVHVAPDVASIFYVDYGNTEDVPRSDVRTLESQFCALPVQALRCSLEGVSPLETEGWSPECISKFQEAVLEQEVKGTFLRASGAGFDVQLEFKGQAVSQMLIEAGLAKKKEASIPSFIVQPGETYKVIVTTVTSPQEFYSQILDEEGKLDILMEQIEDHCTNRPPSTSPISWEAGNTVLAQFTEDQGWYRAVINKIMKDKNVAEVQYIDYGNIEVLPVPKLRPIPSEFCALPHQAVRCCLEGAQFYTYNQDSLAAFSKLLLNNEFQMKCVSMVTSHCAVDLKRQGDGLDLMSYAIQQKIVEPRSVDSMLLPSPHNLQKSPGTNRAVKIITQFPEVEPDSFHDVLVTHVESPDLFYCQFSLHMQDHLDTLMNQLQDVCTTERDSRPKVECSKGDFIAAQFSGDELWYRAQVCDTTVEGVAVCFVDHGNQEIVSHSQIQYLDPEFAKLPAQAVPCSLAEVLPSGGADWTNESVEKFTDMVIEKQFVAQVKLASTSKLNFSFGDDQTLSVALIEEESPISEELVRMGYAKQASTTSLEAKVPEAAAKKPAPSRTQRTLEDSVPITVGARHEVFVSHVESPSSFWLQLASSDEALNTLAEKLEATYSSGAVTLTLVEPATGMQCCAKFSEDEQWYRGIVQSVDPNGVDVRFVDYGNSEVVDRKDIKVLSQELANLPAQSIKCELLNGRPPARSDWSENDIAAFSELVLDKSLYAEFVSRDGRGWQVRLWEGETDIAKQLTAAGRVGSEKTDDCKISELQLNQGETYSVYVAVSISPTEFYVQLSSQCDELEAVMALVADYYNGHQPAATLQLSNFCVAQYSENNAWYRAKIIQIESENSVNVRFVDYGNCESVSSNQILALTDKLSQLPAQAICCSLTPNLTEQFSDDKLEEFFSLDFENEFKIKVCGKESGRYVVQLMHQDATPISDTLLSSSIETCARNQQSFTSLNYTVGSRVDVYLSHIDSPTSFYCQPLELTGELDTMMTKLASTMAESQPEPVQSAVVGQICLARFHEDGEWYRAMVNSVTSDEEIQVTFVDYGNSEWTSRDHLAVLPKEFLSIQVQAVHCSVFETMSSKVEWPQDKVEEFQNLIPESEHCTLTVTGVSESGQLFVEIETSGEKLNFAGLLEDLAQRPTSLPVEELLVHQMSNVSIHETEISTLAVKGSKTPSTELETESESGVEGEPLIRAPFKLSLAVQEEFEASVVHVQSPSLLFIQRLDCQSELNALSTEIEQYCAGFAGKPFQEAFRKGDFVLARYSLNELWHRAQVLEVNADSSAKVSFIDFGNTETISCETMTMCPENFLELPVQAIPCSLAQVPHRESWPPNYKDLIQSLVQDRVVKVGVVIPASQGMRSTITLSDLESGMNIAQPVLDQLQQECEEGALGDVLVAEETATVQKTILPEHSFEIGCSYEVYLVSCTSPHSFVCQLANDDVLETLTAQLAQEYLSDNECHALSTTPEKGDAVCCQFSEDEQWYRARVLSVEGGKCEVLFVDFGNTEVVPVTKLRTLIKSLCSHPPLSFECFLSGIESSEGDEDFDQLTSEKMLELVGEDSATLEVHSVDTAGHLSVTMTTSQGVDISAALIEAGLATLLVPTPLTMPLTTPLTTPSTVTLPGSRSTTDQTPMTGEGGAHLEVETPVQADLEEPIPKPEYVPLPESDTNEEEEEEKEEEEKDEGEKKEEEEEKKKEKEEGESAMAYPSQSLEAGTKLHVVVSSISSMDDFICQNTALKKLMDSISARGYAVGDHRLALQEPKLCLPVCACSTQDETWYRGKITSTKNLPELVTVQYIDYGNSEELAVERIKRLENHFANALPPQSLSCSFSPLCERDLHPDVPDELEPWELVWPLSCVRQFSDLVLGRELSLEVVDVVERGTFVVRLVDLSSGDDIREVIVRKLREPKFLELEVQEDKEEEDGEFHDALDADSDVKMTPVSGKEEETTGDEQVGTEREGEEGEEKSGDVKEENLESEEEEEWSDAREDGNSQIPSEGVADLQEAKGTEEEEGEERKEGREEEGKRGEEEVLVEPQVTQSVEQSPVSKEDVGMGKEEDKEKEQKAEDEGIRLEPAETQSESVEDVTVDQVDSVPEHPMEGGEEDGSAPGTPVKSSDSTSIEGEGGEIELSVTKEEKEGDGSSLVAPLTGTKPPDDSSVREEEDKLENGGDIEQLVNEEEKEEEDRLFLDAPVSDEPLPGEEEERSRERRDPVEGEGEGGGDDTEGEQESVDQEKEEGEDGSTLVTPTRPQESVDQEKEEGEGGSTPVTPTRPQESVDQEKEEGEGGSALVTPTRPQESVDQEKEEGEDGSTLVTSTRPQESVDQEKEEGEDGATLDAPPTVTRPPNCTLAGEEDMLQGGKLDQPVSEEDGLSLDTPLTGELDHSVEVDEEEEGLGRPTVEAERDHPENEEEEGSCTVVPPDSSTVEEARSKEEGGDNSPQVAPSTSTNPPDGQVEGTGQPLNEDEGVDASVESCKSADSLSSERKSGEQVDEEEEGGDGLTADPPSSTLKEEEKGKEEEDGGKERGREDNTGEGGEGEKEEDGGKERGREDNTGEEGGDVAISSEVQPTSDMADLTPRLIQDDDNPTLSCETIADSSSQVGAAELADEGIVCNGSLVPRPHPSRGEKGVWLQYDIPLDPVT